MDISCGPKPPATAESVVYSANLPLLSFLQKDRPTEILEKMLSESIWKVNPSGTEGECGGCCDQLPRFPFRNEELTPPAAGSADS